MIHGGISHKQFSFATCLDDAYIEPCLALYCLGSPSPGGRAAGEVRSASGEVGAIALTEAWQQEMPISPYSIDARFPTGGVFTSLTRIRGTTNEYVRKVTLINWFKNAKVQTLQALQRRLNQNEPAIVGKFHLDVQIGYKQLQQRLDCLLGLHKHVRTWLDSHDDDCVLACLPAMNMIMEFLDVTDIAFAPDLGIFLVYVTFHHDFKTTQSINSALVNVSIEQLSGLVASYRELSTKELDVAKEVKEEPEDEEEKPLPKKADSAIKSRKRTVVSDLANRINFAAPAIHHLGAMVADISKALLYNLPDQEVLDQQVLQVVAKQFQDVAKTWIANDLASKCGDSDFSKSLGKLLDAVAVVFRSSLQEEASRPSAVEARVALRQILQDVKVGDKFLGSSVSLHGQGS